MVKLIIVLFLISVAVAIPGLDLSTCFSDFECLKKEGHVFVITRSWISKGEFDKCGPVNVRNAKNAGFTYVDVYMPPCIGLSASEQVKSLISNLLSELGENQQEIRQLQQSSFGRIWIDIETNPYKGCKWGTDYEANCNYLGELIEAVENHGRKVGVYSSLYMWTNIMGSSNACTRFTHLPLWYARYDKINSFQGYVPFGGWDKPRIKQYEPNIKVCGANIDRNFYG